MPVRGADLAEPLCEEVLPDAAAVPGDRAPAAGHRALRPVPPMTP